MSQAFPDPRALLRRYGLQAKKSWGQNFLVSDRIYRAIVDATVRDDADWVVELGAGLGTLTMRLAERVPEGRVLAVERDRELVEVLERELGHLDNVEVVPANALTYDLRQVARWRGEPIALCGNLPYHLASQIIFRVLEQRDAATRAVFMIQKEMADRLVAAPGTRAYGALGVIVSAYADVTTVVRVSPGAFTPQPKVDSAVVSILPLAEPRIAAAEPGQFSEVVHAAFGQRRKTLRNALRARYPDEVVDRALGAAGIDGARRGETLSLEEFALLSREVARAGAA